MEVDDIYKIGEFSKIVGMTTKTLRYYDNEGILPPSYRDKTNGYRRRSRLTSATASSCTGGPSASRGGQGASMCACTVLQDVFGRMNKSRQKIAGGTVISA